MRENIQKKINIIFGSIIFIGLLLVVNLYFIQIKHGDDFRERANNQYVVATYNSFERGNIFFMNGENNDYTVAAGQKKGYKISVNPSKITSFDKEKIFSILSKYIDIKRENFLNIIKNNKYSYREVAHKISIDDAKKIKKELGKLVSIHTEKWRIYPLGSTASHVIGFLGFGKDNIFTGQYGLERFYNETLLREDKELYTNFFARIFHGTKNIFDEDKKQEGDLLTSIDLPTQVFLEKEIDGIQNKWKSQTTGAIIMDAQNGEILAMGALPNFDNNNFAKESSLSFKNPLVSNVYEFGSIMKPLVVAIGLDKKIISENTTYYDGGSIKIGKYTISNFDKRGRGRVNMQEVLNQSLNTGMVFIAKKIPKNIYREYFKKYGFGEKSGIDLPNDSSGITKNLLSNRDIEFANISFGQGIAVSPISFLKAVSALAHNGKTLTPHLIKKINYTNGFSKDIDLSEQGNKVLSEETSIRISNMLVKVFDNYRKGKVKLPHHSIAAKTGTAQIAHPKGGYYSNRNLHSFFGYFPAKNPRFIVFFYTVYPKGIKYSSQTLLDPFQRTAKYLINRFNVPADR